MNPYASALGTYIGRVFDGKTIISLALIGCTTLLAWNRILDTAAWSLMVTTVALRGASRRRPALPRCARRSRRCAKSRRG